MDAAKMVTELVAWLQEEVHKAGARGAVVGLSGGIDSAVVAALCRRAFPENCLGLILPCHSDPADAGDARLVARHLDLPVLEVVLDGVYDQLVLLLTGKPYAAGRRSLALANLKPRLRMMTLYFHANERNYLVIGTGNRSELAVGYFTKYGDGGVDLLPLANLVKSQVRELARYLRLPERIITKAPSAGLWAGQTDEGEMGLTYEVLDHYLLTGEAPPAAKEKIESMAACSAHKRRLPLVPPF
ncbi:NH(3)-dependent NAD(+) synthetase [Neomoorella glycerini]|uniref:NH(3)-dependent NAD(+) synthetase n=1 Tax=Neomoorella glycerini TaxID=55779 RepID=A0A6I5ZMV5_9FIRM|nr:NAD(+) synthase [Moorella glycerini]QGP90907.1 NH(3)-dependent NAD(+) synthetase [Moorella glycerini]